MSENSNNTKLQTKTLLDKEIENLSMRVEELTREMREKQQNNKDTSELEQKRESIKLKRQQLEEERNRKAEGREVPEDVFNKNMARKKELEEKQERGEPLDYDELSEIRALNIVLETDEPPTTPQKEEVIEEKPVEEERIIKDPRKEYANIRYEIKILQKAYQKLNQDIPEEYHKKLKQAEQAYSQFLNKLPEKSKTNLIEEAVMLFNQETKTRTRENGEMYLEAISRTLEKPETAPVEKKKTSTKVVGKIIATLENNDKQINSKLLEIKPQHDKKEKRDYLLSITSGILLGSGKVYNMLQTNISKIVSGEIDIFVNEPVIKKSPEKNPKKEPIKEQPQTSHPLSLNNIEEVKKSVDGIVEMIKIGDADCKQFINILEGNLNKKLDESDYKDLEKAVNDYIKSIKTSNYPENTPQNHINQISELKKNYLQTLVYRLVVQYKH